MKKNKPDLLQGTLDMLILKTLANGPNHGYGIARRIKQVTDDVLQVEEGSLYPALYRMEKGGFLSFEWQQTEANRRAKYYKLTAAGKKRLNKEVSQWEQMAAAISAVLGVGA